jgi:hypothetical protein
MPTEIGKEWNQIFAYDLAPRAPSKVSHECCDACKEAREIKCVCACGGKNHGAALKKDLKRLDDFNGSNDKALGLQTEPPRLIPWIEIY